MMKPCKYPRSACISRNGKECTFTDAEECKPMDEKGQRYEIREWVEDGQRLTAKVPPVVDAGLCCSCPAVRLRACNAINPKGGWNAYGYAGQKPCPGVLS